MDGVWKLGSRGPVAAATGKGKGSKKGNGKGKGDKSVKPKECFYCGKPGDNKSDALKKKSVQPDKAGRYASVEVDPETGK